MVYDLEQGKQLVDGSEDFLPETKFALNKKLNRCKCYHRQRRQ